MNETQITFGPVTYEISRVYAGDRTASQLVAEQLSQRILEISAFDFDEEAQGGESTSITNQELLYKGWFLPPTT